MPSGKVKWFNAKGYGFITDDETKKIFSFTFQSLKVPNSEY